MTDAEIGGVWTAYILGELHQKWPRRLDFDVDAIGAATKCKPDCEENDFFDDLTLWLSANGYIRPNDRSEGAIYYTSLTEKGFAALRKTPPGFDKPLGEKLLGAAKTTAGEARSATIAALISALIDAAKNL